jgi:protein-disulfide isomerase
MAYNGETMDAMEASKAACGARALPLARRARPATLGLALALASTVTVGLGGSAETARAAGLRPGRTQVVVHTPASRHPVRGDRNAPLNILYWAPFRNQATKQIQPLLKQVLSHYRGRVRLQWMARYRDGRHYAPERYAARVGHEAFAQGGDRLFWRYHDAVCGLSSLHRLSNSMVDGIARKIGLNLRRLRRNLSKRVYAKALLRERDLATRLGVPTYQSSPVLLVGTKRYYISRYTRFRYLRRVIDGQLKKLVRHRRQGASSPGQLHDRLLAEAKKRYKPWRGRRRGRRARRVRLSAKRYAVPPGKSPTRGKATSWATVVAFLDFTDYRSYKVYKALQALMTHHPGKLRLVFKTLPRRSYRNALEAARAAYAAHAQGKFWALADLFFRNRYRLQSRRLAGYAQQAGLNVGRFRADRKKPLMSRRVLHDMRLARKVGVSKAPGIFINGRRVPGRRFSRYVFERMLKRELQGGLLSRLLGR